MVENANRKRKDGTVIDELKKKYQKSDDLATQFQKSPGVGFIYNTSLADFDLDCTRQRQEARIQLSITIFFFSGTKITSFTTVSTFPTETRSKFDLKMRS